MPAVPMPTGRDPVQTARDEQMRIMQQGGGYTPLNLNVMDNAYSNPDPVPLSQEQQLALMEQIRLRNIATADEQAGYIQNLLAMTPQGGGGGGLNSLLNPELQMLRLQMEAGRPQQIQAPQQIRNWADGLNVGVANFTNALNNRMYQKQMLGAIQGYRDNQMAQRQAMQEAAQQRAILENALRETQKSQLSLQGLNPMLVDNSTALNSVLGEQGKRQLGLQYGPRENAQAMLFDQQKRNAQLQEYIRLAPKDAQGNLSPEDSQAVRRMMAGFEVRTPLDTAEQQNRITGQQLENVAKELGLPGVGAQAQGQVFDYNTKVDQRAYNMGQLGQMGQQGVIPTLQNIGLGNAVYGGQVPNAVFSPGKVDPKSLLGGIQTTDQQMVDEYQRQNTPQAPTFGGALFETLPQTQFGQHVGGAARALGRTLYNPQGVSWTDKGIGALGGMIKNNVIPYFTEPVRQK